MNLRNAALVSALFITAIASAQTALSNSDVVRLIATVQSVSAGKLDGSLPAERFDEWLRRQSPNGVRIGWAVNTAGSGTPDELARTMPWVEVDLSRQGTPILAIYVAFKDENGESTEHPRVRRIVLFKGRDIAELSRLREIPPALSIP